MVSKSVGIIGCGSVVQKNYFYSLQRLQHLYSDLFFYDINIDLANNIAKKLNGKVAKNHFNLLDNCDFIIIATPPSTHFSLIIDSLNKNKDVLCEKPFLQSYNEFEQIQILQNKFNKNLYVGHFRRTFSHVKLAHNIIKLGLLGNIEQVNIFEGGRFNWVAESNYVTKERTGGVLFDTGSHSFDTALYISNLDTAKQFEIESLEVQANKKEPSHEIKGSFNVKSNLFSEIKFKFYLSRQQVLSNKIEVNGEYASLIISTGLNPKVKIRNDKGTFFFVPENNKNDYLDNFTLQLKQIFEGEEESKKFIYDRFSNLTIVLEKIAQKNGFEK